MELSFKHQLGLVCVILLFPALCSCQEYYTKSRASFYGSPDGYGVSSGACGFGEYGRMVNNGIVAAVSGRLWRNGAACGTCYQVRCKIAEYCNANGANVVVTDYGEGDRTDFILSPRALEQLGRNNASEKLKKYGVLDIEYKRVPCRYPGNVLFHVKESSNNPGYFAVILLNVNGKYDVTAVELWRKERRQWEPLRRVYGAVFDFANPPEGELSLRFQVTYPKGYTDWVYPKTPIPAYWKPGATYDTKIQLN
ncbi:hypothetical protein RJT34_29731 [Clitoria ternatea]|uniref:Expansin-like B1 n=1 Tax=Clitoria ternatea TaxID=43366 RepID=A0AAN9EVS8_CLITE